MTILVVVVVQLLSWVCLFATPWTVAHQAPLSMGFPRQEYWSGLPFPPPADPGIKPASSVSPVLQADSLLLSHQGSPTILWGGTIITPIFQIRKLRLREVK